MRLTRDLILCAPSLKIDFHNSLQCHESNMEPIFVQQGKSTSMKVPEGIAKDIQRLSTKVSQLSTIHVAWDASSGGKCGRKQVPEQQRNAGKRKVPIPLNRLLVAYGNAWESQVRRIVSEGFGIIQERVKKLAKECAYAPLASAHMAAYAPGTRGVNPMASWLAMASACRVLKHHGKRVRSLMPCASSHPVHVSFGGQALAQLWSAAHINLCGEVPLNEWHRMIPWICTDIFDMDKVQALCRSGTFRGTFSFDGEVVCLHFEKTSIRRRASSSSAPTPMLMRQLVPRGTPYYLKSLMLEGSIKSLVDAGWTVRCVDPGVHRTYVSVDLGTGLDVRWTAMHLRTKAYRNRLKTARVGEMSKRLFAKHKDRLNSVRKLRNSQRKNKLLEMDDTKAELEKFLEAEDDARFVYGDRDWVRLNFARHMNASRQLAIEAAKLAAPRPGSNKTLILWGDASRGGFKGRGLKGPCCALVKALCQQRRAVVVYAPEFRTSKLAHDGALMEHAAEKRPHMLLKACKAPKHGHGKRGCKCFCSKNDCRKRRTKG